eukprot:369888-Rhodomonas_salina.1
MRGCRCTMGLPSMWSRSSSSPVEPLSAPAEQLAELAGKSESLLLHLVSIGVGVVVDGLTCCLDADARRFKLLQEPTSC